MDDRMKIASFDMYRKVSNILTTPNNVDTLGENASNTTNQALGFVSKYETYIMVIIVLILGFLILATLLGNVFVIATIIIDKSLHCVSNYLILSLAITDLIVAVLIMPFSLVNQIGVHWYLGSELCDMWTFIDIMCCTASIMHLVAISLDRYWAVSSINYIQRRCVGHFIKMIVIVWIVSPLISFSQMWGRNKDEGELDTDGNCLVSHFQAFTVYSALVAFYCPMIVLLVLNYKIFTAVRSRIRKKNIHGNQRGLVPSQTATKTDVTNQCSSSGSDVKQDGFTISNASCECSEDLEQEESISIDNQIESESNDISVSNFQSPSKVKSDKNKLKLTISSENLKFKETKVKSKKALLERKRERKTVRVLGIITSAFIVCWLPYFILFLFPPFCKDECDIPSVAFDVVLWVGYFNSLLNPIIYTIFNPYFRTAFNKLLCKKK